MRGFRPHAEVAEQLARLDGVAGGETQVAEKLAELLAVRPPQLHLRERSSYVTDVLGWSHIDGAEAQVATVDVVEPVGKPGPKVGHGVVVTGHRRSRERQAKELTQAPVVVVWSDALGCLHPRRREHCYP
jgi:hypothetical protein